MANDHVHPREANLSPRPVEVGPKQITQEQVLVLRSLAESAASDGCKFLEVGSWYGDSTLELARVAQKYHGHVYCVDWWKGSPDTQLQNIAAENDVFSLFWQRICEQRLDDVVVPIRAPSDVAGATLKNQCFDLVFLDGDHRYDGILADVRQYAPLVKRPGGILCGHDCEGRTKDFQADFLERGKGRDVFQMVHCGVILAVAQSFKNYSINASCWSVRAAIGDRWKPTNLDFPSSVMAPSGHIPLGYTRTYQIFRRVGQVYAVPKGQDISRPLEQMPGLIVGQSLEEIEAKINERIDQDSVPILLTSYFNYNLVQYRHRIYACHQGAGPADLTAITPEELQQRTQDGRCLVAASVEEAKRRVDEYSNKVSRQNMLAAHGQAIDALAACVKQQQDQIAAIAVQLAELRASAAETIDFVARVKNNFVLRGVRRLMSVFCRKPDR